MSSWRAEAAANLLVPVVAFGLAVLVAPLAQPVHDAIGSLIPGPALPVVLVEVAGPLGNAAQVVRAAGARSVATALPAGSPLLDGLPPEPEGLAEDAAGRTRWFHDTRLPLPEASSALVRIRADQLDPSDPRQLAGRDVVLDLADPALGVPALAPGISRPVDRAELLAVGVGAEAAGRGLHAAPTLVIALLSAIAAGIARYGFARASFARACLWAATACVIGLVVTAIARMFALELPIEALVPGVFFPLAVRVATTTSLSLLALDRVALRLGAPPAGSPVRSGLEARGAMAELFAPGYQVAIWSSGPGGRPLRTLIAGDGSLLPDLEALPGAAVAGPGWRVEPVFEDGAAVGALGIGGEGGIPADVSYLAEAVAHTPLGRPEERVAPPTDPLAARIELVSRGVDRALGESETWRGLLGDSGLAIGLFALGGDLVAAGAPLRLRLDAGGPNPLLDLLASTSGFDVKLLRTIVRRAIAEPAPRRVPSQDGSEELVLSRVGRGGRISGILVEIHDIRPHVRLDQLKSTVVVASGVRLRNALTSVAGYAEMARDAEPDQREILLERVRTRIADAVSELDRAEQLAGTRIGENPIQPVFLPDAVREAATSLDLGRRSRIDLSLPEISTPVAARSGPLVRALGGLFGVLAGQGGRVKIEVWPAEDGMRLSLLDDSGGLPAGMLERMVDPDSPSLAGGAVAEIRDMGASLFQETAAGAGTRFVLAFPYYA